MKVLVVNTVPFDKNGITSVIVNYYKSIIKNDITMDFVAINDPSDEYVTLFEHNHSKLFVIKNRKRNPINYMLKLNAILKKNSYDIIHIHGNSTLVTIELLVAFINHIPVRIAHSHNTTCDFQLINNLLRPLFDKIYTHGIGCGDAAGKWLFQNNEFVVLNNGIHLDDFKYNEEIRNKKRKELGISDMTFVIGHIGGFVYQKNHKFLIDFVKEYSKEKEDFKVVLLGDGPMMEEIVSYTKELGVQDKILFLGNKSEVYEYYNVFDLFILPSHFEGLPVVLIEAQANGLKCITSNNVTSQADLVNKLTFVPLDVNIWRNTVESCENNWINRHEESLCNCELLSQKGFDIKRNAHFLLDFYQEASKKKD